MSGALCVLPQLIPTANPLTDEELEAQRALNICNGHRAGEWLALL